MDCRAFVYPGVSAPRRPANDGNASDVTVEVASRSGTIRSTAAA